MLCGNVCIQWLDITTQDHDVSSISRFFQRYSMKAKKTDDKTETIVFDESDNVKITDWTGWTNIKSITKTSNMRGQWRLIRVGGQALMLSEDTNIPVYDAASITGFHGETKYPYIVKQLKDFTGRDLVRVLHPSAELLNVNNLYPIEVNSYYHGPDQRWGYDIITTSNFFNANEFHMFGGDTIPADVKYK